MINQSNGFRNIQNTTECIFAKNTRVMYGPCWQKHKTLRENVTINAEALSYFAALPYDSDIEALVMCLDDIELGETLENLTNTVYKVFGILDDLDVSSNEYSRCSPENTKWRFSFNGKKMHVIVFAPCYAQTNSRYGFGESATYFLFFSDYSFKKHHPKNHGYIPLRVRHQIREAYAKNGRAYDIYISASEMEALKIVKPMILGDCPVRWW